MLHSLAPHCHKQATGGHFLLGLSRSGHKPSGTPQTATKGLWTQRRQARSSGVDQPQRGCRPHQPPSLLAWTVAMASTLSPSGSSPCGIQGGPDPDHVLPLLRNVHGPPLPGVKARVPLAHPQPLGPPCHSPNVPGACLPQGLCTGCALCLARSSQTRTLLTPSLPLGLKFQQRLTHPSSPCPCFLFLLSTFPV